MHKHLTCNHNPWHIPENNCTVCICRWQRKQRESQDKKVLKFAKDYSVGPKTLKTAMEQQGIEDKTGGKRRWHKVSYFMDTAVIDEDILNTLKKKQQFNEQNRDADSKLEIWKYILVLAAACVLAWVLHYSFLRGI